MAKKKGSWIVRITETVERELVCDNCTEEQARDDPFAHMVSSQDIEVTDWDVTEVEPNE